MAVGEFLRSNWPQVAIGVTAGAILCAAIALLSTMPPRTIKMATGSEGGAYAEIGKRYQAALERAGEQLRLVETAGSVDNLALLRRGGVDAALMQGGIIGKGVGTALESLGTLFYEPFWIFHRSDLPAVTLDNLRGRKVSVGPLGSGTRALALELLKRNGMADQVSELQTFTTQAAADKLISGEIDVAFMLASWDAPLVQQLIADERVALVNVVDADAYVALYPFLSKVTVPAGVGDLAKHLPSADVSLFAAKASLVVRADLHPAIQYLLLSSAVQMIHSGAGIFHPAGRFPAAEGVDLPLSDEAVQFYRSGQPFLQNNLPFWIAQLVGRLLVLVIPIFAVLYPMVRLLPAVYGWLMRSKISRLYGELRFLEDEIEAGGDTADRTHLVDRVDQLEKQAHQLRMPVAYESMMYVLRNHIAVVRDRLKAR
jgi:TRAP transporter TAXI family solute receptor